MVYIIWLYFTDLEKAHIHNYLYIRTLQEDNEFQCVIVSDPSFSTSPAL